LLKRRNKISDLRYSKKNKATNTNKVPKKHYFNINILYSFAFFGIGFYLRWLIFG